MEVKKQMSMKFYLKLIHKILLDIVACKMSAILFRPQCAAKLPITHDLRTRLLTWINLNSSMDKHTHAQ